MEVTSPTNPTTAKAPSPPASKEISSDFETFLKMLTVQMENQDPLNPIESSDYAVQLATFSGVEQQVQTNDLLRDLVAQMGAGGMAQMAGWVGMEARTSAPVSFDGTPLTLSTAPAALADKVELVVMDDRGAEVQRLPMAASDTEVTWAGVTADGSPLPAGMYSFEVVSMMQGQEIGRSKAETYARVTEVQSAGGQTTLVLASGQSIPVTEVTAVREPDGAAG